MHIQEWQKRLTNLRRDIGKLYDIAIGAEIPTHARQTQIIKRILDNAGGCMRFECDIKTASGSVTVELDMDYETAPDYTTLSDVLCLKVRGVEYKFKRNRRIGE